MPTHPRDAYVRYEGAGAAGLGLVIAADRSTRLSRNHGTGRLSWSDALDPVAWPPLVAALTEAGFPGITVPAVVPGSAAWWIGPFGAGRADEVAVAWSGDVLACVTAAGTVRLHDPVTDVVPAVPAPQVGKLVRLAFAAGGCRRGGGGR